MSEDIATPAVDAGQQFESSPEGKIGPHAEPLARNQGKGITYSVVVEADTGRSNVNIAFATAETFIRFITQDLKPIADRFSVKVTAEKLPEEKIPLGAAEL